MSKLSSADRNALPSSTFVFPKSRSFPVNDANHARAALSQAPKKGPSVVAAVKAKVASKFPGIGKSDSKPSPFSKLKGK